jgi:hypothetical protein
MKIPMRVLTGVAAAVLAMAQTAQAAPKVSGKYALMVFTQCEARFTTTTGSGGAVTSVNPSQSGELNIGVGSFTFPAVASSAGNASAEMVLVAGGSLRINNSGNAMAAHTEALAGTFSFTNTTFTFDPAGAAPPMTWVMRFGDVLGTGVAKTLYLVRREDARCVNSITATRQLQ